MTQQKIPVRTKQQASCYEIEVAAGNLAQLGETVKRETSARQAALITNRRVHKLYGAQSIESLRAADFEITEIFIGDGERFKTWRTAERVLENLARAKFERNDCVVALGGGVVGDVAGFVASTYLRGVDFINAPTTLLAQIDSSTGGKTGVNSKTGKNLFGTFHQPRAVVVDTHTLATLEARDLTAGWCEAIKHGAVGGRQLFDETRSFLETDWQSDLTQKKTSSALAETIAAHIRFKAAIVINDEREDVTCTDARSRRILNFGHTVAHALETVTDYKTFRHGEAVAYGMLAAAEISHRLGWLSGEDLQTLRAVIKLAGELPLVPIIKRDELIEKISFDKKAFSGSINWVLLERLGTPRIADSRDIPASIIQDSLDAALLRTAIR